jgi:cytochrome P450
MSTAQQADATGSRPAHITDAVYFDFDMFKDPALLEDAHARVMDLRRNAPPIFWTPHNGGHWMLASHKAVYEASRDPETFSNGMMSREEMMKVMAAMPAGMPRIPQPVPIVLDPPEHGAFRAPLQATFSPKAMIALNSKIRALAIELIEAMKLKGTADFMKDVAEPMPVQVFLEMFGLPLERRDEYRRLVEAQMASLDRSQGDAAMRFRQVADVMHDTLVDRRDNPRDDIISLLWKTTIHGNPTTMEDMENFAVLLFIAGLDTVMNGMGHGVLHLARHPELQQQLRANPKLIPEAAEELLRRYTFTVPPRRVAKDTVFHGVEMKAGDRVMLFLPGADLDADEFPEPESFNLERENNVHIAFGVGPHRCLGSHLARIELQILYEELLGRLPEFRLAPGKTVNYHGGHVIGPNELWLTWEA